jgi:hypothetical protein
MTGREQGERRRPRGALAGRVDALERDLRALAARVDGFEKRVSRG